MTKSQLQKIVNSSVRVATEASSSCLTPVRDDKKIITDLAVVILQAALSPNGERIRQALEEV